jgi:hypothetical protein
MNKVANPHQKSREPIKAKTSVRVAMRTKTAIRTLPTADLAKSLSRHPSKISTSQVRKKMKSPYTIKLKLDVWQTITSEVGLQEEQSTLTKVRRK